MRGQVERLRKLATELLDLSRLEAGALELRPEPTDVGQLAREVAGEFTPAAAQHGSERRRCELRRRADRARLRPRARRPGGSYPARQRARCTRPRGPASSFRRRARTGTSGSRSPTRGLGIKRQTMPHIFEPFFTSNDGAQGAGLGLAIARELAERMQRRADRALGARARPRSRWSCRHEAARRTAGAARRCSAAAAAAATTRRRRRRRPRTAQALDHARRGRRRRRAPRRLRPAADLQGRGAGRRDRGLAVRRPGARLDPRRRRRRPGRRRLRLRVSTATARSPPTRTWSPPARATTIQRAQRGLRRVRRRQPGRGEDRRRTTPTPTSRCSRSTRKGLTLRPLPLGASSDGRRSATPVAAIGSPFGEQQSLSVGVVSGRRPLDRRR